ncbi:D-amino acid dehydrogenase [Halomonas nitroreducens]|uniref:FAD-dependent oxidoreductase n=1 Tax=Halomonas nitroreducens TaxID=447425 RepID=A0A3S0HVC8_9GAMM|nr:D-amino acid dehydrogenase [Halomonas nitroreducens]RTR06899.1 FAD-dependent oxidoreductase [Halomonas nitroreducens]
MKETQTVAVLGAGIVGVSSAYLLSQAGYRVTLVEAGEGPALATSFANGGQLSYAYTDAMASWALLRKMPGILLGRDPAFKIRLSTDPDFLRWGLRFLANARASRETRNTRDILRLALHSQAVMGEVASSVQPVFDHRSSGKLHLYDSAEALEAAGARVREKIQWGAQQALLDREACLALDPRVSQIQGAFAGGVHSPGDEVGDAHAFARSLLATMRRNGEIEERYCCRVARLRTRGGTITGLDTNQGVITADRYVLAAGPESVSLARGIGLKLPIYPVKGYSITVPVTDKTPDLCITDVAHKMVLARMGDRLRIAGCADIVGYDRTQDPARLDHLLSVCRSRFPDAGDYDRVLDRWCGFRPVTPSSRPIIGQAGADNLFLNVGHGMLGWTLAMGAGSVLVSQMRGDSGAIGDRGFRPCDHGVR